MTTDHQSYFLNALREDFKANETHPQYQVWFNYALSTNDRGKLMVEKIKEFIPSISNKRHLDIGCGYGGACIAFAQEGAQSIGIDYDERLLHLSRENSRDYPNLRVEFKKVDTMNWDQCKDLGKFDLITCDNVIEHVADPSRLIAQFSNLLNSDGLLYLTAPNAFSLEQIRKDCHYGLFGISLFDPDDGFTYVNQVMNQPFYDVSWYYHYSEYENFFSRFGLEIQVLNSYQTTDADIDLLLHGFHQLLDETNNIVNEGSLSKELSNRIFYRLKHLIQMLETDIYYSRHLTNEYSRAVCRNQIMRDYQSELWYFIIRHKQTINEPVTTIDQKIENMSGRKIIEILWKKGLKRLRINP